jgi:hypothetical protein
MSEAETRINDALRHFSAFIGAPPLALDEHGVCAFTYEQTLEIVLELPPGSPQLYLYAPVMPAPTSNQLAVYERLLHLNAYCARTRSATLALDPAQPRVLLCYLHPVADLDQTTLNNLLTNFIDTLKTLIAELADTAAGHPDPRQDQPPHLDENWQYLAYRV